MTLFLIPEMDEKGIIFTLENEKVTKQDKLIIYHTNSSSKEYSISSLYELKERLKEEIVVDVDLIQFLSLKGIKTIKHSNFYQGNLDRMSEVITQHICDYTEDGEEIKILIPPYYCGDPKIFVSLTLISIAFPSRAKLISIFVD